MQRLGIILGLLLGLTALPIAATAQSGLRFQTDATAPVTMRADDMRWQKTDGLATLTNNVSLTRGPTSLTAERMRVRFENGAAVFLTAQGNVRVRDQQGQSATAQRADFDLQKELLSLHEDVHVDSRTPDGQSRRLSGVHLQINMLSGQARLQGGKSRARIEVKK